MRAQHAWYSGIVLPTPSTWVVQVVNSCYHCWNYAGIQNTDALRIHYHDIRAKPPSFQNHTPYLATFDATCTPQLPLLFLLPEKYEKSFFRVGHCKLWEQGPLDLACNPYGDASPLWMLPFPQHAYSTVTPWFSPSGKRGLAINGCACLEKLKQIVKSSNRPLTMNINTDQRNLLTRLAL